MSDESLTTPKLKLNDFKQETSFENKQLHIEKKVFFKNTKKLDITEKIYISNKQLTSKVKFHQRKKQIELNRFTKFFHLSSIVPSSKQNSKSKQKYEKHF